MEEKICDVLYGHYSENSGYAPMEGWEALNALLQKIPFGEQDKIIVAVCSLCSDYEKQGFTAGIKAPVKTTGSTGGLHSPYKGLLLAYLLKGGSELYYRITCTATRKRVSNASPKISDNIHAGIHYAFANANATLLRKVYATGFL